MLILSLKGLILIGVGLPCRGCTGLRQAGVRVGGSGSRILWTADPLQLCDATVVDNLRAGSGGRGLPMSRAGAMVHAVLEHSVPPPPSRLHPLTMASINFSSASYHSWFMVRPQPYTLRYLQGSEDVAVGDSGESAAAVGQRRVAPSGCKPCNKLECTDCSTTVPGTALVPNGSILPGRPAES